MAAQGQWNSVRLLTEPFSRYYICQYCWSKPGLHSTALCVGMRPALNARVPAAHKAKKRRPRQGEKTQKILGHKDEPSTRTYYRLFILYPVYLLMLFHCVYCRYHVY